MKVCINSVYSAKRQLHVNVPQGSASGANIFTAYCSLIANYVHSSLTINGFADDQSNRKEFKAKDRHDEHSTIKMIETSLKDISKWMDAIRLKLNENKTEFILFGH